MAIAVPDKRTLLVPDDLVVGDTPQAAQMHSILRQLHYVLSSGQVLIPSHKTEDVGAGNTYTFRYRIRPRPQSIVFVFVLQVIETLGSGGTLTIQATIDGTAYTARTFVTTWTNFDPNTIVYPVIRSDAKSSDVEVVLDITASGIHRIDSMSMWSAPRPSLEEDKTDRATNPDRFRQDQPVYDLALLTSVRALATPELGYRTLHNWSVPSEINSSTSTSLARSFTGPGSFTLYPDDFPILTRKLYQGDTTNTVKLRFRAWNDGGGTSCAFTPTSTQNGDSASTYTMGTGVTSPAWSPKLTLDVDCTDLSNATGLQSGTRDGANLKLDITGAMTVYVSALSVWEEQDTSQVSYAKGVTYSRTAEIGVWPADYSLTGQLKAHDASILPLLTLPTGEPAMLSEGSRQNYLNTPEDFSDASWTTFGATTALGAQVAGPDGQQNAYELDVHDALNAELRWTDPSSTIPDNAIVRGSVLVRLREGLPSFNDDFRLMIRNKAGTENVSSDFAMTQQWQRFSFVLDNVGTGATAVRFAIRRGSAGGALRMEIAKAQFEVVSGVTGLSSWTPMGTRGATNATLPSAQRWNANEPWRVRFVPSFSSSEMATGTDANIFKTATGNGRVILQNNAGTPRVLLGSSGTAAFGSRNCTWNAGDLLQIDFDPVGGTFTLSGFLTGDGTASPGAWTWDSGDLYVGSSDGAGTSPFYGLVGEVTSV